MDADLVIEGCVDLPSRCARKARSAITPGYYTLPEPYPVFHITAITHRKDAVYPATIVGIPSMEDFYIGGASVKLFLPTFKMNFLEIVDIALPAESLRRDTDQKHGMEFLREHLAPKLRPHRFQHQAHDHVLRSEQRKRNGFAQVCFYIMDNARKEGLVAHPIEWKFCGAVIPGYPAMHPLEEGFLADVLETIFGRACSRRRKDYEAAILTCSSGRESAQTLRHAYSIESKRRKSEPTHVGCYNR